MELKVGRKGKQKRGKIKLNFFSAKSLGIFKF